MLGKRVHDARIACSAIGIDYLVTFNVEHFASWPLTVITPGEVVSGKIFG